jgi:hypothetical protein
MIEAAMGALTGAIRRRGSSRGLANRINKLESRLSAIEGDSPEATAVNGGTLVDAAPESPVEEGSLGPAGGSAVGPSNISETAGTATVGATGMFSNFSPQAQQVAADVYGQNFNAGAIRGLMGPSKKKCKK